MSGDISRIGELAHRTGVSRRMLRHWDEIGLVTPAAIDRDTAPPDVGDAWITIDASLEPHPLRPHGVYRQTLASDGGVVLQVPVVPLPPGA